MKIFKKIKVYHVVCFLLLLISLGYAVLASNMSINGNSILANNRWDIHWDSNSLEVSSGSVTNTLPTVSQDNKTITYSVNFTTPGDYYEFLVDAVNAGTVDGMVSINSLSPVITNGSGEVISLPAYAKYSVTYADGGEIEANHLLRKRVDASTPTREKYKVRIEFDRDVEEEDLPDSLEQLNINTEIIYEQADENATERESNYYQISFNANGGNVDSQGKNVTKGEAVGELPTPTRDNYLFDGWYTDVSGGVLVNSETVPTAGITYYAHWTANINNATISPNSINVEVGEDEDIVVSCVDVLEGYTYTSNNTSIATVDNTGKVTGVSVGEATITITGSRSNLTRTIDVSVSEVTPSTYTISFDANGGSGTAMLAQQVTRGVSTRLSKNTYTRSGYIFKGWNTADDGSGISYTDEENILDITQNDTITLYAKWELDTFPKVFEQKGACNFNGSGSNITGEECSDYTNKKYIDTGIKLYSSENINKDYEIGFTIVSFNPSSNPKQATLMNTKNETTGYPGLVFRRKNSTSSFELASRKTSSENEAYSIDDYSTVQKVKIYRIKNTTTNIQEIYYSINDGDKVLLNDLSQYNPTFDLNVWFGATPTDGTATAAQRYIVGTLSDMYIKLGTYQDDKYTITYDVNGGDTLTPGSKKIDRGEKIGALPTPTKTDQRFVGWYTLLEGGIEVDENYIPSGSMDIHARWRNKTQYSVTFDKNANDAVGVMNNQNIYEDTLTALNSNSYTRSGYQFIGWNTAYDGNGTSYLDEADITLTDNITLYAQWTKTYTLTFDKNESNAVGNSYTQTLVSGVSTPIDDNAFSAYTLRGNTIDSYNTLANNTGISYYQGQNISITADTILYAHWIVHQVDFETDSWEDVIEGIQDGTLTPTVGDTKTVDMGTFGTHTLRVANTTTPAECSTTGFSQTACGLVLEFADIITTHNMNSNDTNVGGWPASEMRTYVNSDIYNALPTALKNAIIDTTVVSGHGDNDFTNFTSTDKLYLLSTKEIWGKEGTTNTINYDSAEAETRQLDYYAGLNVTTSSHSGAIKQRNGSNDWWWLRSAYSYITYYFYIVNNYGEWNNYDASNTGGVSPAFRLR